VPEEHSKLALEGARVIDMTWVIAGPVATRMLADQGAEVIKLESKRSIDPGRMGGPWLHDINTFPDGGGSFSNLNRNKLGATLNLKTPEGKTLFQQLAAISDVVVNNYRAGTMQSFGLGYDVLREINPRIIMCEMSGMGQVGPYSGHVTYGQTLMAVAGCYEMTGEPDGSPMLPGYTYADFASPIIGAFAIGSALYWRTHSGRGQYIDLSQFQITASLMAESQLEALVNGSVRTRQGNFEPGAIIHNCFACSGEDSWCAIVVRTPEEWAALRSVTGSILPEDPSTVERTRLEASVETWTRTLDARTVMDSLQAVGVEAGRVQSAKDLVEDDEQLRARDYYAWYDHILGEKAIVDGIPYKMSLTPGAIRRGGPAYGIDNDYVFGELLGLASGRIAELRADNVIA
jgi:crotonobetainyl-CoA:carnitine CoA-transferase CaiB-like acyl-CoA transferase